METSNLYEILRCPDCNGKINSQMYCQNCVRNFRSEDNILKCLPSKDLPLLSVYSDINYKKYNDILVESHNYYYNNPNPIIRWVQHSLYTTIIKHTQNKDGLILETGSGPGKLFEFKNNFDLKRYVVLDIDHSSLKSIQNKSQLKAIIHGTAYKLPFNNQIFDTVISCAQLEHLCYLDNALEEIKRVLKPSGQFIASVPTEGGFLWSYGRSLTSARYFSKKLDIDYIKANRIDHFNTIHQIDRALKRHFEIK